MNATEGAIFQEGEQIREGSTEGKSENAHVVGEREGNRKSRSRRKYHRRERGNPQTHAESIVGKDAMAALGDGSEAKVCLGNLEQVLSVGDSGDSNDGGTEQSDPNQPSHDGTSKAIDPLQDPEKFCELLLGTLDPWQRRICQDFRSGNRIALRAANGVGKSKLIAALICWSLCCIEKVRVVATAGAYRQLEMLRYHLRGLLPKLEGWTLQEHKLIAPDGCEAVWYSSDRADLFEGQHEETLVLFIDEAKAVSREIAEASERLQAKYRMVCSTTGAAVGWFYDCFTSKKQFYKTHTVTAFESNFVDKTWIKEQLDMWGDSSDIYKSEVLAEFTSSEEGAFIALENVNRCINNRGILHMVRPLIAGIDLAASATGDESVIVVREGNKIKDIISWRDSDPMRVCGRCCQELSRLDVPKDRVFADAGGLGAGIVSRMIEVGWPVNRIQFGARPTREKERYGNRMTEIWDDMKKRIDDATIILPHDDALIAQLTTRKAHRASNGALKLEPKAMMKRRGLPSPDRADALALALIEADGFNPIQLLHTKTSKLSELFNSDDGESLRDRKMFNMSADGKFSYGQ